MYNYFHTPVQARYIRFQPLTFASDGALAAMRADALVAALPCNCGHQGNQPCTYRACQARAEELLAAGQQGVIRLGYSAWYDPWHLGGSNVGIPFGGLAAGSYQEGPAAGGTVL